MECTKTIKLGVVFILLRDICIYRALEKKIQVLLNKDLITTVTTIEQLGTEGYR
jgi:hypothetical protein